MNEKEERYKKLKEDFPKTYERLQQLFESTPRTQDLKNESGRVNQVGKRKRKRNRRNKQGKREGRSQQGTSGSRNNVSTGQSRRSGYKMGRRRRNAPRNIVPGKQYRSIDRGTVMKQSLIGSFHKQLKKQHEESIGITRRTGYLHPMKMLMPYETSLGNDGINIGGSELLCQVTVYGNGVSSPRTSSRPGDTVCIYPMNPQFLVGTRLAQYATLYEKYKFRHVQFEFVPSVPATQDGSFVMFVTYDPVENYSVTTDDTTQLLRLALGHEGSNMFSIYDYGRCSLMETRDSLQSYYVDINGPDAREEMQGNFVMVCGSSYTNTGTAGFTAGTIVMHYSCDFYTRNIQRVTSNIIIMDYNIATNNTTNTFSSLGADNGVGIKVSALGLSARKDCIYQVSVVSALWVGGSRVNVYDATGQMEFFDQGSVYWGRMDSESSTDAIQLFSSLDFALDDDVNGNQLRWVAAIPGATAMTGYMRLTITPVTSVNNE